MIVVIFQNHGIIMEKSWTMILKSWNNHGIIRFVIFHDFRHRDLRDFP